MKKYKRKKNKNLIRMFIIIAADLITLTIGYSLFTDTLFINGTANIKYVPSEHEYTVIYNSNGGTGTMGNQIIGVGVATHLTKNTFEKTGKFFSVWNTSPDGTGTDYYDEQSVKDLTLAGGTITLYAIWVDGVAKIGDTYYQTLQAAINAVPKNNTETKVELLVDVNENLVVAKNQDILFEFKNHTVTVNTGALMTNNGTVKIKDGILSSSSSTDGAFNNEAGSTLIMTGGQLIMANPKGKQALYNNGGTVQISGTAYLASESNPSLTNKVRAAVHNLKSGNMTVTGGTIVAPNYIGLNNEANLVVGTEDGNPNIGSLTIQGGTYGINSSTNFSYYDGTIKGKTSAINNESKVTNKETGYSIAHKDEYIDGNRYDVAYLGITNTVTFNPNGGTVSETTRGVENGNAIGTLPIPTRDGYRFEGWFTLPDGGEQITPSTIVTADVTYYAHWRSVMVAELDGTKYATLQAAINAVPQDNTEKTITVLLDTSEALTVKQNQNIKLDIQDNIVSNNGNKAVIENNGKIEIVSGKITSDAATATINNNNQGNLIVSGGTIEATGDRQAIYNNRGGTVEITGNAYLVSSSYGTPVSVDVRLTRGTVQNLTGGTVYITGGTIINSVQQAISNEGTMTIGAKDGNINTSSPNIRGETSCIESLGTLNYYDGILKGITGVISGTISDQETNTQIVDTTEVIDGKTYLVEYLEQNP